MNVIHSAFVNQVKKLMFLGKFLHLPQNGSPADAGELPSYQFLEQTNEAYAWPRFPG